MLQIKLTLIQKLHLPSSATNVVRTTGTQVLIAGAKTFTSLLTGSAGVSDGTATMSSGALTGVTTITASIQISGGPNRWNSTIKW